MTEVPLDNIITPQKVYKSAEYNFDAVVIGSGAGGAVVAKELAEAGVKVAIIEEGKYFTARDYSKLSPLTAVSMLYRRKGLTFTHGNTMIILPQGLCVGGTTVINSGTTLRPHPIALQKWRDEHNLGEFVNNFERYVTRCERMINVQQVDEKILSNNDRIFERGAKSLGYAGEILKRASKNCTGMGKCVFGCPRDAKQSMNVSYIPAALNNGAILFTQTTAIKIISRNRCANKVVALIKKEEGKFLPVRITTKYIICAAGALFTPYLLKTVGGLKGKGVGKKLIIHPASRVVGIFAEDIFGWQGVPQGYHLTQFLEQGISVEGIFLPPGLMSTALPEFGRRLLEVMSYFNNMAMLGYRIIEDSSSGRLLFGLSDWPFIWYHLHKSDLEKLKKATVISAEILFSAGAKSVYTPVKGFEHIKSAQELKKLAETTLSALDIELSAYHPQGTARMSKSPAGGAVDLSGQVWGIKNLYVADASILPSPPISNPQLSIMAFATYVAENILKSAGVRVNLC